jgi:hypothetical protein
MSEKAKERLRKERGKTASSTKAPTPADPRYTQKSVYRGSKEEQALLSKLTLGNDTPVDKEDWVDLLGRK